MDTEDLSWIQTEIWPPGPEGVFSGRAPAGAFATRAEMFSRDGEFLAGAEAAAQVLPPEGHPLCIFILGVSVMNYEPRVAVDDATPYSDFAYDPEDRHTSGSGSGSGSGAYDEEEDEDEDAGVLVGKRPKRWKDIVRAAQSCAIIKGVLPCGASAAVVIRDFRPHMFVEVPAGVVGAGRAEEWAAGVVRQVRADLGLSSDVPRERNAIAATLVKRCKMYKFHPCPSNPKRHEEFTYAKVQFPNGLMRRAAAHKLLERRFVVEEWNVAEDFVFHDEVDIPPNAWCIIPSPAYRLVSGRKAKRTLRQFEFEASVTALRSMSAYRGPHPLLIRPDDLPPMLTAFFDIEVASQDVGEFPNATHRDAEITTISLAFAWVGTRLPSVLKRESRDEDLARQIREKVERRFEEHDLSAAREEFRASRAQRLEGRTKRRAAISDRVFDEALERDPELDSEPESDGEEGGWSAVEGKLRDKLRQVVEEECTAADTYPWPVSFSPRSRSRSRIENVNPAACEQNERERRTKNSLTAAAEAVGEDAAVRLLLKPGVALNRTFLHLTMVNTRCCRAAATAAAAAAGSRSLGDSSGVDVPCPAVEGVVIENHDSEASMLMAFRDYVRLIMDVDSMCGYNILGFDWPFMFKRAEMHGLGREFQRLSHIIDHEITPRQKRAKITSEITLVEGLNCVDLYQVVQETLNSKLNGHSLKNVAKYYGLAGKHDVTFKHVIAAHRGIGTGTRSGGDRAVGQQQQQQQGYHKAVIAGYCAQDANLCVCVARVMKSVIGWAQAAKIMRTPSEVMWSSGQQTRVVNMMLWKAHRPNASGQVFILDRLSKLPTSYAHAKRARHRDEDGDDGASTNADSATAAAALEDEILQLVESEGISHEDAARRVGNRKNRFEGGSVLEPTVGFYNDDGNDVVETPEWQVRTVQASDSKTTITQAVHRTSGKVAHIGRDGFIVCEDFASLYPSMMVGMNLCVCTLMRSEDCTPPGRRAALQAAGVRVDEYRIGSETYCFARNVDSVLPELLLELKAARKEKKARMKTAEDDGDSMMALICNLLQLFYKVAMNSVYGAVGTPEDKGKYSCPPIAAVITYLGREHVHEAKRIANGLRVPGLIEQLPCEVIYGDTDSIFVKVPRPNMNWLRAFRLRKALTSVGIKIEIEIERRRTTTTTTTIGTTTKGEEETDDDLQQELQMLIDKVKDAAAEGRLLMGSPPLAAAAEHIIRSAEEPTFTHEERATHAHQVGEHIAEVCNVLYKEREEKSVQLEFEKTIRVMLLWMKKQYGTLYVESLPDAIAGKFKMDVKGLAGKKRDREAITANAQMRALDALLQGDVDRAWLLIRRVMLRMARGHVSLEDILIAKRIDNKAVSLRAAPPAHVSVVWHLEKQMPGQEPGRGEFVKYWLSAGADRERARPPDSVFREYVQTAMEAVKLRREKAEINPQLFKKERQQQASKAMFSKFFTGKPPEKKTIEQEAREDVEARIREHMSGDAQTLHARSDREEIDMPDLFEYMGRMIGCFRVVLAFTKYGPALEELYQKCLRIATRVMYADGYAVTEAQKRAADIGNAQMRYAMHKMLTAGAGAGAAGAGLRLGLAVNENLARCGVGVVAGAHPSSRKNKR